MKTIFQKMTVTVVTFVLAIMVSCNEKTNDVSPSAKNTSLDLLEDKLPTVQQEEILVARLQKDEDFAEVIKQATEIQRQVLDGELKRQIIDTKAIEAWENNLKNAKSDKEAIDLMFKMYNTNIFANMNTAMRKFATKEKIQAKFSELAKFSESKRLAIFSKAISTLGSKNRNARIASPCQGRCSADLNEALDTALDHYLTSGFFATIETSYTDEAQAFVHYLIDYNAAINTFSRCWDGCED